MLGPSCGTSINSGYLWHIGRRIADLVSVGQRKVFVIAWAINAFERKRCIIMGPSGHSYAAILCCFRRLEKKSRIKTQQKTKSGAVDVLFMLHELLKH